MESEEFVEVMDNVYSNENKSKDTDLELEKSKITDVNLQLNSHVDKQIVTLKAEKTVAFNIIKENNGLDHHDLPNSNINEVKKIGVGGIHKSDLSFNNHDLIPESENKSLSENESLSHAECDFSTNIVAVDGENTRDTLDNSLHKPLSSHMEIVDNAVENSTFEKSKTFSNFDEGGLPVKKPADELPFISSSYQPLDHGTQTTPSNIAHESNENLVLKHDEFSLPKVINDNQDSSVVISNNNAFGTEKVIPGNSSLSQLLRDYGSDEDEDDSSVVILDYREDKNEDSDSDSSSSSSSTSKIISDLSESESDEDEIENCNDLPATHKPIKSKGEYTIEDLPPIEELTISVPEEDCIPIGKVYQIVDKMVVVQSMKGVPAYDLDTVLFFKKGEPLGKIFDVLGPVSEPHYCIRFNSKEQIKEKGISLNQLVYCAPKTKYTNYIFLAQLMKLKGSDASWLNDTEPPESCLDYSDDEQERVARKKTTRNGKAPITIDSDSEEPARKRHFAYEKKMNARNLQLTATRNQRNVARNRAPSPGFNTPFWKQGSHFAGSPSVNHNIPPAYREAIAQRFGGPPAFNNRPPFLPLQAPWCSDFQINLLRSPQRLAVSSPQPWRPHCLGTPGSSSNPHPGIPGPPWVRAPPMSPSTSNAPFTPNHTLPKPPSWTLLQPSIFSNTNNRQSTGCSNQNSRLAAPGLPPQPFWVQPMSPEVPHSNSAVKMNFNPSVPPPLTLPVEILSPPPVGIIRNTNPKMNFTSPPPFSRLSNFTTVRERPGNSSGINFNPNIPPPMPQNFKKY